MWIFGYGSLIWKVDFPYEKKTNGYIKGFQRRFWQGSEDHRGVPGKPGRVVTLVPGGPENRVWGVAYKISEEDVNAVTDHLNFREKGGYERCPLLFYPADGADPISLDIFIGTEQNPFFLGPAPISTIAKQIHDSVGPSGPNIDYALNLAHAVNEILPPEAANADPELFELVQHVTDICKASSCHRDLINDLKLSDEARKL